MDARARLIRRCQTLRFRHALLLVAILPSLTFLGHFGISVDIPGTNSYVVLVPGGGHDDAHEGTTHTHESHCHASVATCTDVPFAGASPFALLHNAIVFLGATAVMIGVSLNAWRPRRVTVISPLRRPPQARPGAPSLAFAFASR